MNVLLALSNYYRLTGSEIYTYELARVLKKRGHEVTILANQTGGEIKQKTQDLGIGVFEFFDHPELNPDVVHSAQPNPTAYCLRYFSGTPLVCTIHSLLEYERPVKADQIKTYIFVRPEIAKFWEKETEGIKSHVIYNGVDMTRFNTKGVSKNNNILFVGTIDHLRGATINDLIKRTERDKMRLTIVSPAINAGDKLPQQGNVQFLPGHWNIEEETKKCSQTASIFMGRTTIEGFCCGKPGFIYTVDINGNILDVSFAEVPKKEDLKIFDIEYMTDRVLEVYKEIMQ